MNQPNLGKFYRLKPARGCSPHGRKGGRIKMKKRHFLTWLATACTSLPLLAETYEGACGPSTRYSLDTETGVLSISGTGMITNPYSTIAPWYSHRTKIKEVVVADGVGLPGYEWLQGCDSIQGIVCNSTIVYHVPRNYYMNHSGEYNEEGYLCFLPEGRKIIAPYACRYTLGFERIWIPDGYEEIGRQAFYYNSSFAEVRLPESMKRIGEGAFYHCEGMGGINIPEGLEEVGVHCFNLSGIQQPLYNQKVFFYLPLNLHTGEYTIPGHPERIADGAFEAVPGIYSQLSAVHIPESVKEIGERAFFDCRQLARVNLPAGLERIGSYAFAYTAIETAAIPESVVSIGNYAFSYCNSLTTATLPSALGTVPAGMFDNCGRLQGIELPAGTDSIMINAFNRCSSLRDVNFPESVVYADNAFQGCQQSLKEPLYNSTIFACMASRSGEYTVPDGIRHIAGSAFYSCDTLTAIHLPASVRSIGASAFAECRRLQAMDLPDGLTTVPHGAFLNCSSLASVTLPASVTTIGNYAFQNCSSLSDIQLPAGLETIGMSAFRATALQHATVPEQVDSIGGWAFADCGSLAHVTIRDDIPRLGENIFVNCPNLQGEFMLGDTYYRCPVDATECVIPDGIEHIAEKAFFNCYLLKSVQIPQSVKTIGKSAFQSCNRLEAVTIPDQVRQIADSTFKYCFFLASVQLPDSLEHIGSYAFQHCESLPAIDLPENLRNIGFYTFDNCHQLQTVDLPDGVTSIPANAFSECWALRSVGLSNNLTFIGDDAFAGCASLASIHIPAATGNIYASAFNDCTSLTSITVDEGNEYYMSYGGILYDKYYNAGKEQYRVSCIPQGITEIAIPPFLDEIPYTFRFTESFCQSYPKVRSLVLPFVGQYKDPDATSYSRLYSFLGYIFESISKDSTYTERVDGITWTNTIRKYELPANIKKLTVYCDTFYRAQMDYVASESVNERYGTGSRRINGTFLGHLDTLIIHAATDIDPMVLNNRCNGLEALAMNKAKTLKTNSLQGMEALQSLRIDTVETMEFASMQHLVGLKELAVPFAGAGSATTAASFGELFGTAVNDKMQRVVQFKEDGSSMTYYVPAGLERIVLPEGFTTLPYGAFYGCSMLKEIIFPSTLYMVGERALYGCAGLTDIYCKGAMPSSAYSNTFEGVRTLACKLHVPYKASEMYKRSTGWRDFYYIEEEAPITITVAKNIENAGVVYGLTEYQMGEEAELQAVANSGYVFSGWTENGQMVSTEDTYTFTVTGNRTLIAVFTPVSDGNDNITTTPAADRVSFTWTAEEGADGYRLEVFTDEAMTELAGTLYFDAAGQVVQRRAAAQLTATIDGLEASTDYYYRMTAYDADGQVISQYAGTFSTTTPDAIADVAATECVVRAVAGGIEICGAAGQPVRVFTATGAMTESRTIQSDRESLNLGCGFYIVAVDGRTYKVVVR